MTQITLPPFSAAIFDLDGTLLDSGWVWQAVDRAFFAARGMDEPEDYARVIQGMSFRETAVYTIRRFALPESVDEIMAEWTRLSREAYARKVEMKPGGLDYLRALKRAGVKLAVATANRAELFAPTLERWGALPLFDAVCTAAEVGDAAKDDGALFRLAAEKLGAAPADCVVFEDTLAGVRGALAAGMRPVAVRDAGNGHHAGEIAALAEAVVGDFTEVARPASGKGRCVIFTARCDGDPARAYAPRPGDWVLCADGGWEVALRMGVAPARVIGDFDSSDAPVGPPVDRYPVEKDDTDTMLCLKRGLARGYDDFLLVGGFGGRVDHTLANFQALRYAADRSARAVMTDGLAWATVIAGGAARVPRDVLGPEAGPLKLSVFALDRECRGVTLRGTQWEVEDAAWSNGFPLGVSNVIEADAAEIAVAEGALLAVVCGE